MHSSPGMEPVNMDYIAIISDLHGNIPALEAVLRDIKRRNILRIFCLGDLVGKGPHSEKVVDICRDVCDVTIKGNWDDYILRDTENPTLLWHQQRLGTERLDYLRHLRHTVDFWMSGRRVRLFHASQQSVYYRVHMEDPREKLLEMFTNTEFTGNMFVPDVVGYGDIHRAYVMNFHQQTLFNVGSVGNPLDMTQASYAILEGTYNSQHVETFAVHLIRVPYDIELAIKQAAEESMPSLEPYAKELRTAQHRGAAASANQSAASGSHTS
jgi:protein phosphatase